MNFSESLLAFVSFLLIFFLIAAYFGYSKGRKSVLRAAEQIDPEIVRIIEEKESDDNQDIRRDKVSKIHRNAGDWFVIIAYWIGGIGVLFMLWGIYRAAVK